MMPNGQFTSCSANSGDLTVALLAAGAGSRMGGGKLDRDFCGRPLGAWALFAAHSLGVPVTIIVPTGPNYWLEQFDPSYVRKIANQEAATGMASSLARAIRSTRGQHSRRLLVMLADMPFVKPDTLRRLVRETPQGSASASRYCDGRLGPPACFSSHCFTELLELTGDAGAGSLLNRAGFAKGLAVDPAELIDIDTVEDLKNAALTMTDRLSPFHPSTQAGGERLSDLKSEQARNESRRKGIA